MENELEARILELEDEIVFLKKENRKLTIKLEKTKIQKTTGRPKYKQHHYEVDRKK